MRLAILSEEAAFGREIESVLKRTGHDYEWFCSRSSAGGWPSEEGYDLALVIKHFRQTNGQCLAGLRERLPPRLPVVVTDPADLGGLLSRLGASGTPTARLTSNNCRILGAVAAESNLIRCPPYTLDTAKARARLENRELELTPREFDLAAFLFKHPNQTLNRERLLQAVWGYGERVMTRTLDTHVSRLRNKLELTGTHGWTLKSVYQRGYRLECPGPDGCPTGA